MMFAPILLQVDSGGSARMDATSQLLDGRSNKESGEDSFGICFQCAVFHCFGTITSNAQTITRVLPWVG